MTPPEPEIGRIITFCSFKGGTGRSMALANVACLLGRTLAGTGKRALIVDWDLEAPGVFQFFPKARDDQFARQPGVLDYFIRLEKALSRNSSLAAHLGDMGAVTRLATVVPLEEYVIANVAESVDLISLLYARRRTLVIGSGLRRRTETLTVREKSLAWGPKAGSRRILRAT